MMQSLQRSFLRASVLGVTLLPTSAYGADSAQCAGGKAAGIDACNGAALTTFIGNIINTIFTIIGILAVLILLIGAIRYITSTGDAKRIQSAKETILYAIIGLIVAILARAIVAFVIGKVG